MYVTIDEVNSYLETDLDETLATSYIEQAESILHSLCHVARFDYHEVTDERHDYKGNGPYYLKEKPVGITEVNGTAVSYTEGDDYLLRGRKIEFASNITIQEKNTKWSFVEFSYNAWYQQIPSDIINAVLILVGWIRTKAKWLWLSSYTQWDISITYAQTSSLFGFSEEQHDLLMRIVSKYKFIDVYS